MLSKSPFSLDKIHFELWQNQLRTSGRAHLQGQKEKPANISPIQLVSNQTC